MIKQHRQSCRRLRLHTVATSPASLWIITELIHQHIDLIGQAIRIFCCAPRSAFQPTCHQISEALELPVFVVKR